MGKSVRKTVSGATKVLKGASKGDWSEIKSGGVDVVDPMNFTGMGEEDKPEFQPTDTTEIDEKRADIAAAIKKNEKDAAQVRDRDTPQAEDPTLIDPGAIPDATATNVDEGESINVNTDNINYAEYDDSAGKIDNRQIDPSDVPKVESSYDDTKEQEIRARQMAAIIAAEKAAAGETESIAAMQARMQGDRALAQALAAKAGAVGPQAALTRRSAGRELNEMNAQIAEQSGVLKLEEQKAAQERLDNLLSDVRGTDIEGEKAKAKFKMEADITNQGVDLSVLQTNLDAAIEIDKFNIQTELEKAREKLKADLARMGLDLEVALTDAAAGNAMALKNLEVATQNADRQLRALMKNIDVDLDVLKTNAAAKNSVALANLEAALRKMGLDDNMVMAYMQNELGLTRADIDLLLGKTETTQKDNTTQYQGDIGQQAFEQQEDAALTNAISSALAPIVGSDINLKKNIKNDNKKLGEFLASLKPFEYEYKDKKHGEGLQASVMAQDLEKSEIGQKAVQDTPEGKFVDYAKLLPAMLAANVDANERIMTLEEALKAKKGKK